MKRRSYFLAAIALTMLYAAFLGRHGVLQQTEARYAEVAREMKESGDFLVPTLNEIPLFQKPPVSYWATVTAMSVFGVNEVGVRAAPVAAALGVLFLTGWVATTWFSPAAGLLSVAILASFGEFFLLSRHLCADMIMTFWIVLSIAAFAWATRAERKPGILAIMPYFIFMGVAFATKGPMGIVVPLCVGVFYQVYSIRHGNRFRVPWFAGLSVTLFVGLLWFVLVASRYPELWNYFLEYELYDRLFTHTHGNGEPVWYFIVVLLGGCLPWTPYLLPVLFSRPSSGDTKVSSAGTAGLIGWIAVPLVMLSFSGSQLATYILPIMPGIAVWFGCALSRVERSRILSAAAVLQCVFLAAVVLGAATFLGYPGFLPEGAYVEPWFLPSWLVVGAVAVGAAVTIVKGITTRKVLMVSCLSLTLLVLVTAQIQGLAPTMDTAVSLKPLAQRIRDYKGWENAQIVVAGARGHGLEFYLERPVDTTYQDADIAISPTPEIARRLHLDEETITFAPPGHLCFVLTRARNVDERRQFQPPDWIELQREGAFVLLKRVERSE